MTEQPAESLPVRRISDPESLKALAHPLRQRLLQLLSQRGPATVGTLAGTVDRDPGHVSYHLRELAKRGFIEEAPEYARDRRETWWQVVAESTSWSREDFTSPEDRAVFDAVYAQTLAEQFDRLRHFAQTADDWTREWQRASVSDQAFLSLTAAELRQMVAEMRRVSEKWARISEEARGEGEVFGREPVYVCFHAIPDRFPETLDYIDDESAT